MSGFQPGFPDLEPHLWATPCPTLTCFSSQFFVRLSRRRRQKNFPSHPHHQYKPQLLYPRINTRTLRWHGWVNTRIEAGCSNCSHTLYSWAINALDLCENNSFVKTIQFSPIWKTEMLHDDGIYLFFIEFSLCTSFANTICCYPPETLKQKSSLHWTPKYQCSCSVIFEKWWEFKFCEIE